MVTGRHLGLAECLGQAAVITNSKSMALVGEKLAQSKKPMPKTCSIRYILL
jgi:hypothetical protein